MRTPEKNYYVWFEQNVINKIGYGRVLAVPYDTAWLARIPDPKNLKKSMFPQAIDWIRSHQHPEGYWGTSDVKNAHSNTLSTLAAVLALLTWQNKQDQLAIDKGIVALSHLAGHLPHEAHETIGFELLLPSLINDLKNFGVVLPDVLAARYENYQDLFNKKYDMILKQQAKIGIEQPSSWWFSLELLQGLNEDCRLKQIIHLSPRMLSDKGSVAASPSATAYLLGQLHYQHQTSSIAYEYLVNACKATGDTAALPNVFPIDEFELIFVTNYLLEAGIPAQHTILKTLFEKIRERWQTRGRCGFGYSSHFFIDPDCSANGVTALLQENPSEHIDPKIFLNFFNGNFIETYYGERDPSVSTNLHTLRALRLLKPSNEIQFVIDKIIQWLRSQIFKSNALLTDKWHASPIYPISRAIVSLSGLDDNLARQCVTWLLTHQHEDGGWGMREVSTREETAFASLALSYWHQGFEKISRDTFKRAIVYLNQSYTLPDDPLWIGKVLYCPTLVAAGVVAAASYALNGITRSQCSSLLSSLPGNVRDPEPGRVTSSIAVSFDLGEVFLPPNDQIHLRGSLLRIASEFTGEPNYNLQKQNETWLKQFRLCDSEDKILKANIAYGSQSAFRIAEKTELEIYSNFALWILILDDVLDENSSKIQNKDQLSQILISFLNILQNLGVDDSEVKAFKFPKYDALQAALKNIQQRLKQRKLDTLHFVKSLQRMFKYVIKEFNYRNEHWQTTSEKYLNIRAIVGGLAVSCELAFCLRQLELSSAIRKNRLFLKYKMLAARALILANDILSLTKEKEQHANRDNYILIKKDEDKITSQDAVDKCISEYNQTISNMHHIRDEMFQNNLLQSDPSLVTAIDIIASHVQAHVDWALATVRYRVE